MHITARSLVLPTTALVGLLALTACGGSTATSGSTMPGMGSSTNSTVGSSPAATGTPATGEHNDADVTFVTGMLPHHGQAVQMADLAATRASSAKVKALAVKIKAAQAPEIAQMRGWLAGWGIPVPSETGMGSMDHSSGSMAGDDGMMSDQDMSSLGDASGAAFDTAFLTGMTAHHQGAVAMAKVELASGSNDEAKKLAQAIITSQSQEITQMAQLLAEPKG